MAIVLPANAWKSRNDDSLDKQGHSIPARLLGPSIRPFLDYRVNSVHSWRRRSTQRRLSSPHERLPLAVAPSDIRGPSGQVPRWARARLGWRTLGYFRRMEY